MAVDAKSSKLTKKDIPASAAHFSAACEFAEPVEGADDSAEVTLLASSGIPFEHPYWGHLVFDIAGIKANKARIPIDYCHRQDDVIGYGELVKNDSQLYIKGALVSTKEGDRASEVLAKGRAGVPWEASVKFDPWNGLVVEEYQPGTFASVNGQQLEGPLTVIRQSLLRGVAVCPYGADPGTDSQFTVPMDDPFELSVTVFAPAEVPEADEQAAPDTLTEQKDPRLEFVKQLGDYTTRFGTELGAKWFAEGKTVLDCYADFVAVLATEHAAQLAAAEGKYTAAEGKIDTLNNKLKQLGEFAAGEQSPLSSVPVPSGAAQEYEQRVADLAGKASCTGVAKFAAGMRLPKTM